MSGVLAQRFGRKKSRIGGWASSVKYWYSSYAVLRHAKYVYDWLNPALASQYMIFGLVNASARKITSGSVLAMSASSRSQNFSGLYL